MTDMVYGERERERKEYISPKIDKLLDDQPILPDWKSKMKRSKLPAGQAICATPDEYDYTIFHQNNRKIKPLNESFGNPDNLHARKSRSVLNTHSVNSI